MVRQTCLLRLADTYTPTPNSTALDESHADPLAVLVIRSRLGGPHTVALVAIEDEAHATFDLPSRPAMAEHRPLLGLQHDTLPQEEDRDGPIPTIFVQGAMLAEVVGLLVRARILAMAKLASTMYAIRTDKKSILGVCRRL